MLFLFVYGHVCVRVPVECLCSRVCQCSHCVSITNEHVSVPIVCLGSWICQCSHCVPVFMSVSVFLLCACIHACVTVACQCSLCVPVFMSVSMFTLCAHVHECVKCSHWVSVFLYVCQGFHCMSVSVFAVCICQCSHCVQVVWSRSQSTSTGVLMRSADSTALRWSSKSVVVSTSPVMRMVCSASDQVYSQNERRMLCTASDQVYSCNETSQWKAQN